MNFISPLTLLLVPLIGSIIILFLPYKSEILVSPALASNSTEDTKSTSTYGKVVSVNLVHKQDSTLKQIALLTSVINLIISIIMWIQFDSSYIGYQFTTNYSGIDSISFLQLNLGVDGISLYFVLLTTFITPIALLSSHRDIHNNLKFYLISILLLETLQIAVFVAIDLLLFYVFFESVLIPLFLIIGI